MNLSAPRILIYRVGQMGDTIVALPAIWAIRQHFPTAYLAFLSDEHNETDYVLPSSILPHKKLIDKYITYRTSKSRVSSTRILQIISKLRQERFHILVYLAPRLRTRRQLFRDLMFFRLAGITRFIGHRGIEPYPRCLPGEPLPELVHEADHLLSRLSRSGVAVPPPGQGCMDLCLSKRELQEAEKWLDQHGGLNHHKLLIGLGVGSKYPAKVWPEERFEVLGHYIINNLGGLPIIFGGPEDRAKGDRLISKWKLGINAAGELTVRRAAAALSFCRLYVGNDTGTMHLAAAVGTRCIGIFSARDFPGCWHPYGPQHVVLRANVACAGCLVDECLKYDMACLKLITVEDVVNACNRALTDTNISWENKRIHVLESY